MQQRISKFPRISYNLPAAPPASPLQLLSTVRGTELIVSLSTCSQLVRNLLFSTPGFVFRAAGWHFAPVLSTNLEQRLCFSVERHLLPFQNSGIKSHLCWKWNALHENFPSLSLSLGSVKIKIAVVVSRLELYFSKPAHFLNTLGLISCVHLGSSL